MWVDIVHRIQTKYGNSCVIAEEMVHLIGQQRKRGLETQKQEVYKEYTKQHLQGNGKEYSNRRN
jgi:hypothetical protein